MEYTWQQFIQLDEIHKLPLNEQTKRYSFYPTIYNKVNKNHLTINTISHSRKYHELEI